MVSYKLISTAGTGSCGPPPIHIVDLGRLYRLGKIEFASQRGDNYSRSVHQSSDCIDHDSIRNPDKGRRRSLRFNSTACSGGNRRGNNSFSSSGEQEINMILYKLPKSGSAWGQVFLRRSSMRREDKGG